ncbi:hypothetical protein [Vallitalea guaymasensis]|uniref:hypothetical protein n=1 Tax=Vallitalea guaymasensis TaxID=1185412 RepID=UPI002729F2BB|nr:hypothetical protein [Vallitalea guaymasensis]
MNSTGYDCGSQVEKNKSLMIDISRFNDHIYIRQRSKYEWTTKVSYIPNGIANII